MQTVNPEGGRSPLRDAVWFTMSSTKMEFWLFVLSKELNCNQFNF